MNPLAADLDHILLHTRDIWEELRNRRIFITGGTGFFGRWLLESFVHANDVLGLNAEAWALTRNPVVHLPDYASIRWHRGDFTNFDFPDGEFHAVIHAATVDVPDPLAQYRLNVSGTERVLEFTRTCGASRFLFTSSGAAYGTQPPDMTHIPEDYEGAPDTMDPRFAYGQSKRACEFLCAGYARQYGFAAPIARCFAFSGPHLPLNLNFAIGNFVRDALGGGPIQIGGDGTPRRSYLYAADLAIWLWTILFRGESCRVYNVGSSADLSIAELAGLVANVVNPAAPVQIAKKCIPGAPVTRYVPSVERAEKELKLKANIALDEGIRRMAQWANSNL